MPKQLQIAVRKPCHENWNDMTPTEQGRFCGSCQKQVVDFTRMSDSQLAAFFKKESTGSVCGRFMPDQLDRSMLIPKKRIPWVRYFFQFSLPLFLTSLKAQSQNRVTLVPPEKINKQIQVPQEGLKLQEALPPKYDGPVVLGNALPPDLKVSGVVNDESGHPVVGATIMAKGTNYGVTTDSEGKFILDKLWRAKKITLVISSVGFKPKQIVINTKKMEQYPLSITVKLSYAIMGDIDVTVE